MIKKCSLAVIGKVSAPASRIQDLVKRILKAIHVQPAPFNINKNKETASIGKTP